MSLLANVLFPPAQAATVHLQASAVPRNPFDQIGDAYINARLRQQGTDLTTMVRLMVEKVQQQASKILPELATRVLVRDRLS